jgi:hypothetical protein
MKNNTKCEFVKIEDLRRLKESLERYKKKESKNFFQRICKKLVFADDQLEPVDPPTDWLF